ATHRIDDGIELAQLGQQHAAGKFVHAEIGSDKPADSRLAGHFLMQGPKSAQVVEPCRPFKQDRIIGDDRASFPRRNRFVDLQAVNANVANRPERSAPVAGPDALGAVFQYLEPTLRGDSDDAVHIARVPLKVSHHDDPGLWSNLALNVRRVNVKRFVNLSK